MTTTTKPASLTFKFGEALLDVIMSADAAEQNALRFAYDALIAEHPARNVPPLVRDVLDACKEAFELIDEAKAECV